MNRWLILFAMLILLSVPAWAQEDTQSATEEEEPPIELVKAVSVDGGVTWDDAQVAPGPRAEIGGSVRYLLTVTNDGDSTMTNITLSDDRTPPTCVIPPRVDPGQSFSCTLGPVTAVSGLVVNTSSVSASINGETITASDVAHYYGGDIAQVSVEKLVGIGGVWYTADEAPGLTVPFHEQVSFRIIVTNDGTRRLSNFSLTDDRYDLAGCEIPEELPSGLTFECVIGPFELDELDDDEDAGQQQNVVTVGARGGGTTVTATDLAFYRLQEQQDATIVIVEGPIESIDGNIVIVLDQRIVLDPDDPLLSVIRVGDMIRVAGHQAVEDDVTVVIAVVVVVLDADIIVVDDDRVWRDEGRCANPPPPWAPAHGWRRKCQGATWRGNALPPGLRKKDQRNR